MDRLDHVLVLNLNTGRVERDSVAEGAGMLKGASEPSRLICMTHRRDGFTDSDERNTIRCLSARAFTH